MSDDDKQTALTRTGGSELRTIENTSDSVLASIISAIDRGTDPKDLEIIVGLQERLMAQQAKREFGVAMAAFKSECPQIPKSKQANIVSKGGAQFSYKFASLDDIGRITKAHLSKCGLSYRWSKSNVENGNVSVTCIISHIGGHSEESTVSVPVESPSGASPQQKHGIANTYAQRYSLIQALGLTTCDEDVDGNQPTDSGDKINEDEELAILSLMGEVGADTERFLKFYKIDLVSDLLKSNFREAINLLEGKRK